MVRRTRTFGSAPDLAAAFTAVAPRIEHAARRGSATLRQLGIRHAIVGGLAVGAHGHPRATKDVDFFVGPEAFETHDGDLVTMVNGFPFQVGGVLIDALSYTNEDRDFMERALANATESEGIPVIPVAALVYLKLLSPRTKDAGDIIELFKAGVDPVPVLAYINAHAPALSARLERLIARASSEDEEDR